MKNIILLACSIIIVAYGETFVEYQQRMGNEQEKYIDQQNSDALQWQQKRATEYASFQQEILTLWGEVIEPSKKVWVEYDSTQHTVSSVNFEKGTVRIEVLLDSSQDSEQQIQKALNRLVKSKGNSGATPTQGDGRDVTNKPILAGLILVPNSVDLAHKSQIQQTASGKNKKVVILPLVPNHLQKRIDPYLPIIRLYSKKYHIPLNHILATIHTESYFNPMARSGVGAIGLMQLMPQYGGREAYQYVKGVAQNPTAAYLYNPQNNLELGIVYIYLLENKYLSKVTNTTAKQYCAIAAYNTGPGNLAKAFTGNKNLSRAISEINKRESKEVYHHLIKNLPYDETKGYLRKVVDRLSLYNGVQ